MSQRIGSIARIKSINTITHSVEKTVGG